MYNVLIVEDVPSVRNHISRLLREYHGTEKLSLIGMAGSAEEALDILRTSRIDILLTDIYMTPMDGLELLEQALAVWPDMKAIVISAYDKYDYMRTALKLNVSEYLLKPVNKDEFEKALDNVCMQLGAERKMTEEVVSLRQNQELQIRNAQLQTYLKNIPADIPAWIHNAGTEASVILAVIAAGDISPWITRLQQEDNLLLAAVPIEKPYHYMIILNTSDSMIIRNLIEKASAAFSRQNIYTYFVFDHCAEVGSGLYDVYLHLMHRMHRRFEDPDCDRKAERVYMSDADILFLQYQLTVCTAEQAGKIIRDEFDAVLRDKTRTYRSFWKFFREIQSLFISVCTANGLDFLGILSSLHEQSLSDYINPEDARDKMAQLFHRLVSSLRESKKNNSNQVVEYVRQYLEKNYADEIRLKNVANILYLSEDYLGRLFHSETGETFSGLLTRIRMEHAMSLILETEMKTTDIAISVGYNSISNFIASFRKYYGSTPSAIRKDKKP